MSQCYKPYQDRDFNIFSEVKIILPSFFSVLNLTFLKNISVSSNTPVLAVNHGFELKNRKGGNLHIFVITSNQVAKSIKQRLKGLKLGQKLCNHLSNPKGV